MSTLRVDNLNARTGTTIAVPTGTSLYAPGHVIQVRTAIKTDIFTMNSGTYTDITGLSVTITPTSTSSRILVTAHTNCSKDANGGDAYVRLVRGSTAIGNGNSGFFGQVAGQDYFAVHTRSVVFLDSPATTSTLTYKLQGQGGVFLVNGRGLDSGFQTSSTICVMEIAQ
jgi:hypothetical protein